MYSAITVVSFILGRYNSIIIARLDITFMIVDQFLPVCFPPVDADGVEGYALPFIAIEWLYIYIHIHIYINVCIDMVDMRSTVAAVAVVTELLVTCNR